MTAKKEAPQEEMPQQAIQLEPLKITTIDVPIIGLTPLITNRWSDKAKRMLLENQTRRGTKAKRELRNPQQDYEDSIYRLPNGQPGVPAGAFRSAIVAACRLFDGLTMTLAKQSFNVQGEGPELLIPLMGEPQMREDMVRVGPGTADIRFRAMFDPWGTVVRIRFNEQILSQESILHLVSAAGNVGICEWRPSAPKSASGSFGMFQVFAGSIETLRKEIYGE